MRKILLPVGIFFAGLFLGSAAVWLWAKPRLSAIPQMREVFDQTTFGVTRESILMATLLKEQRYNALNDMLVVHIEGGLAVQRYLGPQNLYLENAKLARGYFQLVTNEPIPPLVAELIKATPASKDPRPIANLSAEVAAKTAKMPPDEQGRLFGDKP